MKSRTWNRPLPNSFYLGGERRFSTTLPQPNQGWILRSTFDNPPVPAVEPLPEIPGMSSRFFPRFSELSQVQLDPVVFDSTPYLKDFSWDWIEFYYRPQINLEVSSHYWAPDSGVICGESWIKNLADGLRIIVVDLVCLLQSQGAGNQITLEEITGRPVLSGELGEQNLLLFLAGNPNFREDPYPYLQTTLSVAPHGTEKIHWICIKSNTKNEARDVMENVLQLDWPGEISRRKVSLQSQLEITTGDSDWDFVLALSQKQAQLKYHQLTSGEEITPFQALMLLQSLENQTPESIEIILDLVFNDSVQNGSEGKTNERNITPPLLAAELLWQIHQAGFNNEIWSRYQPIAAEWLEDWFSARLDSDADGVPELQHPLILDLARSDTDAGLLSDIHLIPYPYLESPGLSALLYNDLCKMIDLTQSLGSSPDPQLQDRKDTLSLFLEESWNPDKSEFQNRDSASHGAVAGSDFREELLAGLNILRVVLTQPTRIGVLHHGSAPDHAPEEFSIIFHGLDWCGNYRIEELPSGNFTWAEGIYWGISESIFANLDYCILKGAAPEGEMRLINPSTSSSDITQMLPLWAGILPPGQIGNFIESILLDGDRYWSPYGFSSNPAPSRSTVQLPWNLLLGQSLLKYKKHDQAAELVRRWMSAIIPEIERSGSLFPGYEVETGWGAGEKGSLESLFPVKFFLKVLGIAFIQDAYLIIEGKNPFPWPVKLYYRGLTIRREKDQTIIIRPGKENITLTDPDKFILDLN